MPALTRAPKPDPSKHYICLDGFVATTSEGELSVRQGERLRGDDPLVCGWPQMFCDGDFNEDQVFAARQQHLRRVGLIGG